MNYRCAGTWWTFPTFARDHEVQRACVVISFRSVQKAMSRARTTKTFRLASVMCLGSLIPFACERDQRADSPEPPVEAVESLSPEETEEEMVPANGTAEPAEKTADEEAAPASAPNSKKAKRASKPAKLEAESAESSDNPYEGAVVAVNVVPAQPVSDAGATPDRATHSNVPDAAVEASTAKPAPTEAGATKQGRPASDAGATVEGGAKPGDPGGWF